MDDAGRTAGPGSSGDGSSSRAGTCWRAGAWLAAGALLVLPFLPVGGWLGTTPGGDVGPGPGEWALGLGTFVALAWLAALVVTRIRGVAGVPGLDGPLASAGPLGSAGRVPWNRPAFVAVLVLTLAAILALVSLRVYGTRPVHVDGVAQLFQAKIFASGRLVAPPLTSVEAPFFVTPQMILDGTGWFSQYPPGHPGLLALGVLVGAPWIVPVTLSVATALLLYAFARRAWDVPTARWTLGLVVLSPFVWRMGASHMSHVSALFFTAATLWLAGRWDATGSLGAAAGAGAAVGATFLVRPLDAVAPGLFLATTLAVGGRPGGYASGRRHRSRAAAVTALALLTVAALYPIYNYLTTGAPLEPGYLALWGGSHGLGFHETPYGGVHTPLVGLLDRLADLSLLQAALFEWPLPSLLPAALLFLVGAGRRAGARWDRRLLAGFLALPAAYVFYWHRDASLGPRFLYAGLAFLLPLSARGVRVVSDRARAAGRRLGAGALSVPAATAWAGLLLLCFAYSVGYAGPGRLEAERDRVASMRVDVREAAREAGVERGLVFVPVSWGNRILAELRGRGVSASLAERAYRGVDHCDLHLLIRRSAPAGRLGDPDGAALADSVAVLVRAQADIELAGGPSLNGDPTLRLRPGRDLPEACRREILYDHLGYTIYTPHLPVNGPDLGASLVVARDLREANRSLMARYPDRKAFLYRGGRFAPVGRLRAGDASGGASDDDEIGLAHAFHTP